MLPTLPGQRLPNGTILLDEVVIETERDGNERYSVVLAVANATVHKPFVTWDRRVTCDAPTATGGTQVIDTTIWGHYHTNLSDATNEFVERVAERQRAAV